MTILAVPVVPDAPEAQRWLQEELAKPPYVAARPTWFDTLSQAFFDWLGSLTAPGGSGWGGWIPAIVVALVLAAALAAWLIYGPPRRNRRAGTAVQMFGADDRRSADDMRRAAQSAARAENWSLASEEIFRALAADLSERTVLTLTPGTTAHGFAERASAAFPAAGPRLRAAADVFDRVRYLGVAGADVDFQTLAALESDLRQQTPIRLEPLSRGVAS
ncbi:hypothetical protein JF66_10395 [Cryobacterium sp. MLB-32]|uniref:DUF4129 domain-containing protein n=1 Tax=Cryobacterium sp. MLB-32 TaxID=1529318 RepID=UPI0004E7364E|nr:DUF4129 domain-containing protein [Cryobacterium sp. MLB-32]KFF59569.1 hypothetical protein JF66_10395 [Cryobacterium sp. MLB-32]